MTPYYQDGTVTIYHGDCRELLPQLRADVLVADPPYGIHYSPRGGGRGWTAKTFTGRDLVQGDDQPFDPLPLLTVAPAAVLFGANHYASRLPASPSWLVWDKRDGLVSNDFADCELAWSNLGGPARLYRHRWSGALRDSERGTPRVHPTQKPLSLMTWVLELCPPGTVIDPYMGSGTTLVAAKNLGRRAIGVELEERYCEIAARRCAQEVLPLQLSRP